jgi:hypothetical protein
VILYRCFAWNVRSSPDGPDGPLWCPRSFQGDGRHDNPDDYGCYYCADRPVAAIVEQLARFRSQRLLDSFLKRRGLPLALAELQLSERATLIDLDDPAVLRRERLRPSAVATRTRARTQHQALTLYRKYPDGAGLRWWSMYESLWTNVTIFHRAASLLTLANVSAISLDSPPVQEAADWLGLLPRR